jgi:hypothetical protein
VAIDSKPRIQRPAPIKRPLAWHIRNGAYIYPVVCFSAFVGLLFVYSLIAGLPEFPTRNYIDARIDLFFKAGSVYRQVQALEYVNAVHHDFKLPTLFISSLFIAAAIVSALVFYNLKVEQKTVIHRGQKLDTKSLINELKRSQK